MPRVSQASRASATRSPKGRIVILLLILSIPVAAFAAATGALILTELERKARS